MCEKQCGVIYGEGELSDGSVEESFFHGAFHITTKYTKYKNEKKMPETPCDKDITNYLNKGTV